MKQLNEALAELRTHLGVSQSELARVAGISRYTWIKWESGEARPSPDLLKSALERISQRWGIDPSALLGDQAPRIHNEVPDIAGGPTHRTSCKFSGDSLRGLEVAGDAMYDVIHPHDLVVVDTSLEPLIGMIVAAKHASGSIVVRELGHAALRCANSRYAEIPIEEAEILGVVVGVDRTAGGTHTVVANPEGLKSVL